MDDQTSEQQPADEAAAGAERELVTKFEEAFPSSWDESGSQRSDAASRLCGLWRSLRRRLLLPLRTAAGAFFTYMRLSEEQRAPQAVKLAQDHEHDKCLDVLCLRPGCC